MPINQSSTKCLNGNTNIPTSHSVEQCTPEEYKHRVEEIIKCKNDIVYFAENYFYIVHPDIGKHKIKLYPKQLQLLKMFVKNKRVIVTSGRQLGKCVFRDTKIKIKNKQTGETKNITIEEFEKMNKNK